MKIWKPVYDHPNYEVSQEGDVRRTKNERELKPYFNDRGYQIVGAWLPGQGKAKTLKVAKMVWETFNDCKCRQTIDHIDRNKKNNHLSNLRCISNKENNLNKPSHGKQTNLYNLDDTKKREIIRNVKNGTWTGHTVYKLFGIPSNYLSSVLKRGTWNHLLNEE